MSTKICPECLFEPYVEGKPHLYGGRATSGLTCYGPKIRRRVVAPPTEPEKRKAPPLIAKEAATKAGDVVDVEFSDPVARDLASAVEGTTPKKEKRKTKPELAREKLLSLGLGLRTGSSLPAPDPTKRSSRRADRVRPKPKRRP